MGEHNRTCNNAPDPVLMSSFRTVHREDPHD